VRREEIGDVAVLNQLVVDVLAGDADEPPRERDDLFGDHRAGRDSGHEAPPYGVKRCAMTSG